MQRKGDDRKEQAGALQGASPGFLVQKRPQEKQVFWMEPSLKETPTEQSGIGIVYQVLGLRFLSLRRAALPQRTALLECV